MLFALLVPDPGARRAAARDRLADTVAVVLALAYGLVMMLLGDATRPGAALVGQADLAIGAAGAAALLVRRRHPLAVTVTLLPLGAVSVAVTGPVIVALFTLAVRRRPSVLLPAAVANVATGAVYFLLHDSPAHGMWMDLVVRSVITVAAVGWGLFVQAHRRLTTSLREHAARLEAEQALREEQARLTERARIARETHDVLAHRMSLISLHAGALEVRAGVSPEELSIAAGAIRSSAHDALEELRSVIGVPSSRPEPPQPGLAEMDDLIGNARAAGMTVDYVNGVPAADLPAQLGRTAYRIVQEGLTNAHRHGSGPAASVRVTGEAGRVLRITIINPLAGTVHARSPGVAPPAAAAWSASASGSPSPGATSPTARSETRSTSKRSCHGRPDPTPRHHAARRPAPRPASPQHTTRQARPGPASPRLSAPLRAARRPAPRPASPQHTTRHARPDPISPRRAAYRARSTPASGAAGLIRSTLASGPRLVRDLRPGIERRVASPGRTGRTPELRTHLHLPPTCRATRVSRTRHTPGRPTPTYRATRAGRTRRTAGRCTHPRLPPTCRADRAGRTGRRTHLYLTPTCRAARVSRTRHTPGRPTPTYRATRAGRTRRTAGRCTHPRLPPTCRADRAGRTGRRTHLYLTPTCRAARVGRTRRTPGRCTHPHLTPARPAANHSRAGHVAGRRGAGARWRRG
ncbi:sensor histidine kinase [Actinoplanes sp. CA-252034]|uniref:sensor histidine kinase n=1 Tax=Actinoplanes sp. CA-252034 TaxID=3239906 RepID=UPI003D99FBD2